MDVRTVVVGAARRNQTVLAGEREQPRNCFVVVLAIVALQTEQTCPNQRGEDRLGKSRDARWMRKNGNALRATNELNRLLRSQLEARYVASLSAREVAREGVAHIGCIACRQ